MGARSYSDTLAPGFPKMLFSAADGPQPLKARTPSRRRGSKQFEMRVRCVEHSTNSTPPSAAQHRHGPTVRAIGRKQKIRNSSYFVLVVAMLFLACARHKTCMGRKGVTQRNIRTTPLSLLLNGREAGSFIERDRHVWNGRVACRLHRYITARGAFTVDDTSTAVPHSSKVKDALTKHFWIIEVSIIMMIFAIRAAFAGNS